MCLVCKQGDSLTAFNHLIKVFLNESEMTELSHDCDKAFHVNPGIYEVALKAGKKRNDLETVLNFSRIIEVTILQRPIF